MSEVSKPAEKVRASREDLSPSILPKGSPRWTVWRQNLGIPVVLFLLGLAIFATLAWKRLPNPSSDTHFVYQANAMLAGSLELQRPPPHRNDWASYFRIKLRSGEELRGVWLDRKARTFRTLNHPVFQVDRADFDPRGQTQHFYVSFPPGPAVLMLPLAAIWGYGVNDVVFTVVFAALNLALMFVLLRTLSARACSERSLRDNLWLTALFGLGTVHLWCAVLGQVWFTALIVGVTFTLLYMWAAIDARRPFLAGLFLACAFATRTPLLFSAVFFLGFVLFPEGRWRTEHWREAARTLALFCAPCLAVGLLLLWSNQVRFGAWWEFGHTYLAQGQLPRIQKYGLFHYHFLSKNLSAALTLLPRLQTEYPYVMISRHGMSLLVTTPAWIYLARARKPRDDRERFWRRTLWLTVIVVAIPALFYQNTGYVQFGYRFSLDYTPYLVALLAVGRRPLTVAFRAAIVAGIAVNLFGAVTFRRFLMFYRRDGRFFDPD